MGKKEIIKNTNQTTENLVSDLKIIIEERKSTAAMLVNNTIVQMCWEVGKRINEEILGNERSEYGKQILVTMSQELQVSYGKSFEYSNLTRMIKFAKDFSDKNTVAQFALLSWSHVVALLPLKEMNAKIYYAEEAYKNKLGVRDLRHLIARKAYERRDISNLQLSSQSKVPFNTFKDPYLLDVLDLKENYLEADLEKAIMIELEKFVLEFGHGFSFVARQKRITYEGHDYYIDLLFFHRELRRLVAIELKLGKFKLEYKGQMEGYLRMLNLLERKEGEEQPIGIILCTEANRGMVELLEMDKVGIAVSEFWTKLPPKEQFESKIQEIMAEAQERLERRQLKGDIVSKKQLDYFIEPKQDDYPDED